MFPEDGLVSDAGTAEGERLLNKKIRAIYVTTTLWLPSLLINTREDLFLEPNPPRFKLEAPLQFASVSG